MPASIMAMLMSAFSRQLLASACVNAQSDDYFTIEPHAKPTTT